MQIHLRQWLAVSRASLAAAGVAVAATGAFGQLGGVGGAVRDAVGGAGRAVDRSVDRTVDRTERQVDRTIDRADRQLDRVERQGERAVRQTERQSNDRYDDSRGPVRDAIGDTVRGAGRIAGDAARAATGRGRLGVTFDNSRDGGLIISNVEANSAAYRAGLRDGDQIVSLGGRRFDDYRDAVTYIRDYRDDNLDLVILRDGRRMNLAADLGRFVDGNANTGFRSDRPALGVWFDTGARDATILRVAEGSPAYHAGIRPGDRILALDGRRVSAHRDVTRYLADLQPGEEVDILVWRNGRQLYLDATLAMADEFAQGDTGRFYEGRRADAYDSDRPALGVVFDDYDRDSLVITRVESGSPAFRAGLRRGDRIYSIDGRRINGYRELTGSLAEMEADADVSIGVIRDGRRVDLDATLAARSAIDARDSQGTAERREQRFDDRRERIQDRFDERLDRTRDRVEDRADRISDGLDERRDRVGTRFEDERDDLRDGNDRRADDARDRFDRTREARRSEFDRTRDRVREDTADAADDVRGEVRRSYDDARNRARDTLNDARDRVDEDDDDDRRRPPHEPRDESPTEEDGHDGSSNRSDDDSFESDE